MPPFRQYFPQPKEIGVMPFFGGPPTNICAYERCNYGQHDKNKYRQRACLNCRKPWHRVPMLSESAVDVDADSESRSSLSGRSFFQTNPRLRHAIHRCKRNRAILVPLAVPHFGRMSASGRQLRLERLPLAQRRCVRLWSLPR